MPDFDSGNGMARDSHGLSLASNARVEEGPSPARARHHARVRGAGAIRLSSVFDGGAARQGGLYAGDLLVAIDGLHVTQTNLHKLLARRKAGDAVEDHVFRRDELMRFGVKLQPAEADQCRLTLHDKPQEAVRRLRRGWIGA